MLSASTGIIDPLKWMCESVSEKSDLLKRNDYRAKIEKLCMQVQGEICCDMENIDSEGKFIIDKWQRTTGSGGGITCVMSDGRVFEKAGVNISAISGVLTKPAVIQMKAKLSDIDESKEYGFFACGISSVIHPRNPHVPACHFNYRYFELEKPDGSSIWWYGGGSDLTPNFLVEEDVEHFHRILKTACDRHDQDYYPTFKGWCDKYFFIPHRNERRGVGGIFFDDLSGPSQEDVFLFVQTCAHSIRPAYLPLVVRNMDRPFTDDDRDWQLIRRGRYVEFNLIYDRGTKFGLATPEARIESIMMSLPLLAKWVYCHEPDGHPQKKALLQVLKEPRSWV